MWLAARELLLADVARNYAPRGNGDGDDGTRRNFENGDSTVQKSEVDDSDEETDSGAEDDPENEERNNNCCCHHHFFL